MVCDKAGGGGVMDDFEQSDDVLDTTTHLDISKEKADWLLEEAGKLMSEDPEHITIKKYEHLLSDKVHLIILEVLHENAVSFQLMDFQLLTLHCLGSLKNVVLICPTGAGKMLCSYLGTLVLRKVFGKTKGAVACLQ